MTIQNIPLFQAMTAKMDFLDKRQQLLANNIANADTPDYRPMDVKDLDFGRILDHVTGGNDIQLETTHAGHLPPPNELPAPRDGKQKVTYEVAPAGNAVILEEQMVKATHTTMDYNLMTNLLRKQTGMIRTALGRGQ